MKRPLTEGERRTRERALREEWEQLRRETGPLFWVAFAIALPVLVALELWYQVWFVGVLLQVRWLRVQMWWLHRRRRAVLRRMGRDLDKVLDGRG